jgi:hypothetical protein
MMKKLIVALIIVFPILTSCSYYTYHIPTGSSIQIETKPETIKIYSGDIEQEYIVIGSVAADVMGGGDDVVRYLKKKAAKLGADAIIHVDLTKMKSFAQRTGLSGVAVKLK